MAGWVERQPRWLSGESFVGRHCILAERECASPAPVRSHKNLTYFAWFSTQALISLISFF